jgi:choice-of-anchor A domain-containing protein
VYSEFHFSKIENFIPEVFMISKITVIACIVLASAIVFHPSDANADPITDATILQNFNAVIYGNASTTSDIEGAAVVGGNFSGATVYNQPSGSAPVGYGAITVYGNTSGNSININNGGSAYVGGQKGAHINFNGGGGYLGAPVNAITDFKSPLNALSLALSMLPATGSLPIATNNELITATAGANGIAVIDFTAAELAAIPSFRIDLNGASSLIFNVTGASATYQANDESGTAGANNIIWNFYDATGTVNLNSLIAGTVLAPGATVSNQNQIDGVLVAGSWTGSGELHDYQFDGTLPSGSSPVPVPEPGSLILFATGVVALGLLRLKKSRR